MQQNQSVTAGPASSIQYLVDNADIAVPDLVIIVEQLTSDLASRGAVAVPGLVNTLQQVTYELAQLGQREEIRLGQGDHGRYTAVRVVRPHTVPYNANIQPIAGPAITAANRSMGPPQNRATLEQMRFRPGLQRSDSAGSSRGHGSATQNQNQHNMGMAQSPYQLPMGGLPAPIYQDPQADYALGAARFGSNQQPNYPSRPLTRTGYDSPLAASGSANAFPSAEIGGSFSTPAASNQANIIGHSQQGPPRAYGAEEDADADTDVDEPGVGYAGSSGQ